MNPTQDDPTHDVGLSFGQGLRLRLEAAGVTGAELARRMAANGFSTNKSTISRWINDEDLPRPAAVSQIARAIGHDPHELLGLAGYLDVDAKLEQHNPRLLRLLLAISAGWQAMDDPERDIAERGAFALFATSSASSNSSTQDGLHSRRNDASRQRSQRAIERERKANVEQTLGHQLRTPGNPVLRFIAKLVGSETSTSVAAA